FLQDNTPAGVGDEYRLAVAHLPAEPLFAARLVALLFQILQGQPVGEARGRRVYRKRLAGRPAEHDVPTRVQVMFSGAQPATQPDVTVALLDVQLPAEVSQIHIPIGMGDLNIAADCVQRGVAIHLGDLHILLYVTGGEIAMNELNLQRSGVAEGGVAMNRANLERA